MKVQPKQLEYLVLELKLDELQLEIRPMRIFTDRTSAGNWIEGCYRGDNGEHSFIMVEWWDRELNEELDREFD
jgi:hypothetical protein